MEKQKLNIIAFDVPYPPNYGGIVDVFYKLKYLHEAGLSITYHCFHYKGHNPPTEELEKYCDKLIFYERKRSLFKLFFSRLPYIVSSRDDHALLMNLIGSAGPILMDGIQCTYWLLYEDIHHKGILYRANNIEHEYYEALAHAEKNLFKKWYLRVEAKKLRNHEWELRNATAILSVSKQDMKHYEQYGETHHVPPFYDDTHTLDFSKLQPAEKFVLFQGNLSVMENENAALHIMKYIAPLSSQKFVIAGMSPSKAVKTLAALTPNIELIDTPAQDKMSALIRDAQIHLLMTHQQTGIKLKLLHALQSGRHIIINSLMDDSGIFGGMCEVLDDSAEIAARIEELMSVEFTQEMKETRDEKFNAIYSNKKKAKDILEIVKRIDPLAGTYL